MDEETRAGVISLFDDLCKIPPANSVKKRQVRKSEGNTTIIESTLVLCGSDAFTEGARKMLASFLAERKRLLKG